MLRIVIYLLLICASTGALCAVGDVAVPVAPESFKTYIPIKLENSSWSYGYVFLAPELAKNADVSKQAGEEGDAVLRLTINKQNITIWFDEGPSDDPGFVIEIRGDERIYDVGGSTVFVSAEGHFYTSARMNQDYQKRQKYRLSTEGLTEVTQAYYLVDSQCAVTELTQLYSLPCGKGHVVASIPQGGRVQVMLHDANAACAIPQYLVSSSFGLVGWVGSESGLLNIEPGKPLNCISFYGD